VTSPGYKPRVVILGGGMAGLVTAWELSRDGWRSRYGEITVYQRGWRLGGKGASSRGRYERIEEHGLHVLLGYYQDTFRIMDECYRELDRPRTSADCPIQTWSDAVYPAVGVGLTERAGSGGTWDPWSMDFPRLGGRPGARASMGEVNAGAMALQSLRLLAAFYRAPLSDERAAVTVAAEPGPEPWAATTAATLRRIGLTALAGIVEVAGRGEKLLGRDPMPRLARALGAGLGLVRERLWQPLTSDRAGKSTWTLVDLVMTNLVGIVRDRLLVRPEGLRAIDDMDYRDWLARHGAAPETLDNAIIRGMYDLVFAYREGDPGRPAFAAGLGLELATRMLLDYDGSLFWKMRAGMGEVIFAPLYEVLAARGVGFEFFHRVDELTVADGAVASVRLGRQAALADHVSSYQPLIDAGGLPAWPAEPDHGQLAVSGLWLEEAESHFGARRDVATVELVANKDFDVVIFAASLGMVPEVCKELMAAEPRWQAMVDNVATVATQAFQVWLSADEGQLGWDGPPGVTLSGFVDPFDTWASMSHLVDAEGWPAEVGVGSIAYFCGSMSADAPSDDADVKERAIRFLDREVAALWPRAVSDTGFRWELLADDDDRAGPTRFDGQYWRANTDPSDRYVQSLPGTDRYRLSPGDTGFSNLVIAGDWTDCGLNAGCVEAAARSGILAAQAVAVRTQEKAEATHD